MERIGKPWLANDTIFAMSSVGREQKRILEVLHGFTENVWTGRQI